MFSFITKTSANNTKLAYDFNFNGIDGNIIKLSDYKIRFCGCYVASRCGIPQYNDLQDLFKYKNKDLIVLEYQQIILNRNPDLIKK